RALARLSSPNVVTVYDVVDEDHSLWLVMELVAAPSLHDLVTEGGPLDDREAARIGLGVLAALRAAHHTGLVHRDVKPANVLVPRVGPVKLADFGIASLRDDSYGGGRRLVAGSPCYMAPEQARGEEVGPPADMWGLGALLYFAVERQPPFAGGSVSDTVAAVLWEPLRPRRRPGPLTPLLMQLMDKRPERRPPAPAVRRALEAVLVTTP